MVTNTFIEVILLKHVTYEDKWPGTMRTDNFLFKDCRLLKLETDFLHASLICNRFCKQ